MKTIKASVKRLVAAVTISAVATISFAQTSMDTIKTGKANDAMNVSPGKANDKMAVKPARPNDGMSMMSDTAFINKNISDNKTEIELAIAARDKGTSPEVKKIAALMVADHTAMLNDLESLATKKGGAKKNKKGTPTPPVTLPAEKDFDRVWAAQMLMMHEAKIAELESFVGLTKDEELKTAVLKAIPKLKMHRQLLLKLPGAKESAGSSPTI